MEVPTGAKVALHGPPQTREGRTHANPSTSFYCNLRVEYGTFSSSAATAPGPDE